MGSSDAGSSAPAGGGRPRSDSAGAPPPGGARVAPAEGGRSRSGRRVTPEAPAPAPAPAAAPADGAAAAEAGASAPGGGERRHTPRGRRGTGDRRATERAANGRIRTTHRWKFHSNNRPGGAPVPRRQSQEAAGAGAEAEAAETAAAAADAPDETEEVSTEVTLDDFEIVGRLGEGAFGRVMLVRKTGEEGRTYAMKVLSKADLFERQVVEQAIREKEIMQTLHHPFIVTLQYAFQNADNLFLVMTYVSGGAIYSHLSERKTFPEDWVRFYGAQIVLAFGYLHEKGIVYRDLKLENLMLADDGYLLLTDFGLAKDVGVGGRTETVCGTPEYFAPEIVQRQEHDHTVDWWTLGVILFEMLTGQTPFKDSDPDAQAERIMKCQVDYPNTMSVEARALCSMLLRRTPSQRLGAGGAQEVQIHLFFASIDWDALRQKAIPAPLTRADAGVDADVQELTPQDRRGDAVKSKFRTAKKLARVNRHLMTRFGTYIASQTTRLRRMSVNSLSRRLSVGGLGRVVADSAGDSSGEVDGGAGVVEGEGGEAGDAGDAEKTGEAGGEQVEAAAAPADAQCALATTDSDDTTLAAPTDVSASVASSAAEEGDEELKLP